MEILSGVSRLGVTCKGEAKGSVKGQTCLALREKQNVALSSVLAALFLTAFKLVIGLKTNSLGILSEAAHSGLDLVAAFLTFFAVRVSSRPADKEHPFGHGKVENMSALLETLLLLATCSWIIYEAIGRLFFRTAEVEAGFWAFLVMGVAIVVDLSRSRVLYRTARRYNSQALEADALHFSTDVWSSSVVIVGLILVRLGHSFPNYRDWFIKADALSALVVAGIVMWVSLQLGYRAWEALLDKAPSGLEERVRSALLSVEDVRECGPIRLRTAGPVTFVEVTVRVSPEMPTAVAHEVAMRVEEAICLICPSSDVTVHVEPVASYDSVMEQVRALAARSGLSLHNVHIHRMAEGYHVDLDLEVPQGLSLKEAHQLATAFEGRLRTEVKGLVSVETHIEATPPPSEVLGQDVTNVYPEMVKQIRQIAESLQGVKECHNIRLRQVDNTLYVSLHCLCPQGLSVEEAHRCAQRLETQLRQAFPQVAHFLIHTEPEEAP